MLRRYRVGAVVRTEEYDFSTTGWKPTLHFLDYQRGHIDYDTESTTSEAASAWIEERLRGRASRGEAPDGTASG